MSTVTVTLGQSIQAAIDSANPGDTIDVQAGTYQNQFLTVEKSLTLEAIGGPVILDATVDAPNGKAIVTEGQPGLTVNISGFDISGAVVGDNNGAAIRYEGGTLNLSNVDLHNNQEGLLGAADPNGTISIDHSEIDHNGEGSGSTHNLYVGAIAKFTLTNSYVHDAVVGHEIKSRAATTIIQNNRVFDNNGSASYSIDLPNGGNASISGNLIEQGPNTQNPFIIAYGEEGASNPGTNVSITGNTVVNDDPSGRGILDPNGTPLGLSGNQVFGLPASSFGSDTVLLSGRPSLDTSSLIFIAQPAGSPPPTEPPPPPSPPPQPPPPIVPPTPPPPALTLSQYHTLVLADFNAYSKVHPEVWHDPVSVHALMAEISSPVVLTTPPPGDLWTPHT
jgi:hypothetical protein